MINKKRKKKRKFYSQLTYICFMIQDTISDLNIEQFDSK